MVKRARAVLPDLTPLRTSRDFRLLFWAGLVFYLGQMISYVALPWQVYKLTHSNLAVGLLGAVEVVPLLCFGLYGGALADHADRRRILVLTGLAQLGLTAALAVNGFLDRPSLPVIYVVAGLLAAAGSLQRPSRDALFPRTVRHEELPAAMTLLWLGTQVGFVLGPTIGGLLAAHVGAGWCFTADAVGLALATILFAGLGRYPHLGETEAPSLAGIGRALSYAMGRRDLLGTYLVDIAAMFLATPVVLFPALAEDVFGRPELLGPLYTAEMIGSILATATAGWVSRVHHHGRAIVIGATAYGACVLAAGVAPSFWLVLVFLGLSGTADMISGLFRGIVWNQTIPDSMRGRLAGVEMLSYSIGPYGGQVRAGLVADLWSVRGAVASGGAACMIGVGLTALWLRDFWSYDNRTNEHAVAQRALRDGGSQD